MVTFSEFADRVAVSEHTLVTYTVAHAQTLMQSYRSYSIRAKAETHTYSAQRFDEIAYDSKIRAHTLAWPLRMSIEERTREEVKDARYLAANGPAVFLVVACAGETCEDCERPLRHHINIDDGSDREILCPIGRRFWQIARAIAPAYDAHMHKYSESIVATIARRP